MGVGLGVGFGLGGAGDGGGTGEEPVETLKRIGVVTWSSGRQTFLPATVSHLSLRW